jgi:hypothetical protein
MSQFLKSLFGNELGLTAEDALAVYGLNITRPTADAVIAVGAVNTHARVITVQLNTARAQAIAQAEMVEIFVMSDITGDFAVTGGTTGLADSGPAATSGSLLPVVAKKYFKAISTATGLLNLTYTDTTGETCYLMVRLPNGRTIYSAAITAS